MRKIGISKEFRTITDFQLQNVPDAKHSNGFYSSVS